jgi:hypothetical protein
MCAIVSLTTALQQREETNNKKSACVCAFSHTHSTQFDVSFTTFLMTGQDRHFNVIKYTGC